MTDTGRRRLLAGFFLAVLIGCVIGAVAIKADGGGCDGSDPESATCYQLMITNPNFCNYVQPWSWWWYFAGCNERMAMTLAYPVGGSVVLIPIKGSK